uniref:DDE-1 domain-containing protein n=1 Tax=Phytophthora ramorum TaxID=164328 RepID=H3GM37_PHYRM
MKDGLALLTILLKNFARTAAAEIDIPDSRLPRLSRGGWCKHFLARHGYRVRRTHGEIHSVDVPAAIKGAAELRAKKIAKYDLNDVFNVDEAAYFYKVVSRVSVCLGAAPALKVNKSRMTFLVGSKATGSEKLWQLVLGKSKKPRWLPEKPDSMDYVGTSKGWMTTPVFNEWLVELNKKVNAVDKKILLLYDNAPVHKETEEALSYVEIARLPKNITAILQPMDQGVIAWIKARILNDRSGAALLRVLCVQEDACAIDTADAM